MTAAVATHPDEKSQEAHVIEAIAASGNTNCRHNDKYKLDAIKACSSIKVGQKAKEQLTNHGAQKSEEVDEQPLPSLAG